MSEPMRASHPIYNLFPEGVEGFDALAELALDMRWTWNHATDEVWRQLDPVLWDQTHHPCDVLQTVSREKIRSVLADPAFRKKLDALVQSKKQAEEAPAWFQQHHPETPAIGAAMVDWQQALAQKWSARRFGEVKLENDGGQHEFEVQVYLDDLDLDPEAVRVELYADGVNGAAPERMQMQRVRQLVGAINGYAYRASVPARRPGTDYTARIVPRRDDLAVPLEDAHILWQR